MIKTGLVKELSPRRLAEIKEQNKLRRHFGLRIIKIKLSNCQHCKTIFETTGDLFCTKLCKEEYIKEQERI